MSKDLSDLEREHSFEETMEYWRKVEDPSGYEYEGGKQVNEEFQTEKNDSQSEKGFGIDRSGAVDAETAADVPQLSRAGEDEGSCNEGDLTVGVTGIKRGKAEKLTAIGLEDISRNNKRRFEDSTYKVKTHGSCNSKKIEVVGMTGGEAKEVEVIGTRTVSEGNQLIVERSEVDVSGHAGTGGHAGTALPGLSGQILNSTVIVNGGQTSGSGGNLLGQINDSRVVPGTDNQGQNVDITETTESEVGDIEVTRKRMASEGALSDQDDYKMENQKCSFSTILGKLRIAVIGGPGSGKSSTANTLLGREAFESLTKLTTEQNNSECKVIDTPGLWQGKIRWEKTQRDEFLKCLTLGAPGLHVFLLVIKIRDSIFDEKYIIEALLQTLGKNIERFLIVVFTAEDHLEENNLTLEEYIQTCPSELKTLLERCNNRFIAINNRGHSEKKRQAKEKLLYLIIEVAARNEGVLYTRAMFEDHFNQQKGECILS